MLLQHALTTVDTVTDEITRDVRDGLMSRLKYRIAFLRAVMAEPRTASAGSDEYWKTCIDILSTIESTHASGQVVHEAFSAKTQRRLASTVPPRPIIKLEFPICLKFLRQLFTNALEAAGVLNCHRVSSVVVRERSNSASTPLTAAEFLANLLLPETAACGIHSMSCAGNDI